MNTSSALRILNTTLRMATFCGGLDLRFDRNPLGVGVAWHGEAAWDFANLKSRIGLDYEIVTRLPEPEDNLYPPMLSLMRGESDISIHGWGVNYKRSKLVDFTYPKLFSGEYIISSKPKRYFHANLITEIFDDTSLVCIILAFIAMTMVTWLFMKSDNQKRPFITCVLYTIGNVFNQPLSSIIIPKALTGRAMMTLFSIYNYVIWLMYSCIIMSLLIVGSKPPTINTLQDLNKTENLHLRIVLAKRGYSTEFLKDANMLSGLEHRIDYHERSEWSKPHMIQNILRGSHVGIFSFAPFYYFHLCKLKGDDNKAIASFGDFRHSMYVRVRGVLDFN